jgi:catechol 2,3-dioxygenase-like lactoylglutathione lyase family enzyme
VEKGKVVGFGGVFIKFKNPDMMRNWYKEALGMITNPYGVLFHCDPKNKLESVFQLGTFPEDSDYFGSDSQKYMINFRVDNMDAIFIRLAEQMVTILDAIESYEYGKFLHIEDPEGNRIELWEAIDQPFLENDDERMIQG